MTKAQTIGYDDENDHPITDKFAPMPTLNYHGTVKVHGCNAGINLLPDGDIYFQSRNGNITPEKDNYGFARHMSEEKQLDKINLMFDIIERKENRVSFGEIGDNLDGENLGNKFYPISIFGEYCGGSIQKGIALSSLPKMFIVFAIKVGLEADAHWVSMKDYKEEFNFPDECIFNTEMFETFDIEIDFENPKVVQQQIVDWTTKVGDQCPVGKYFGATGIGEGIVFAPSDPEWVSSKHRFKSKDERHSKSKIKKMIAVDPLVLQGISDFIEYSVTDIRLNQGIDYLIEQNLELSQQSTGKYLKWLFSDVMKEEHDTLAASNLKTKDVSSGISKKGREWFFEYLDKGVGLE